MASRKSLRMIAVIPCRNDAKYLEACLQAFASQTRLADQIIVVDNCSDDDTRSVAEKFGATVVDEVQLGVGAAAARGYDEAVQYGADIIARVDADSIPPVDWLERIEGFFLPRPSLDAVTGIAEFYECTPLKKWAGETFYTGALKAIVAPALGRPAVFGSNFAMRSELWRQLSDRVVRTDPNIHDDLDLSINMPATTRVVADQSLIMPVSGRPFDSWHNFSTRIYKAFVTFGATWPLWLPWVSRNKNRR